MADIDFYMAFGYWKLACILQGVYARYVAGAGAGRHRQRGRVPRTVRRLAELAATTLAARARREWPVSPEGAAELFEVLERAPDAPPGPGGLPGGLGRRRPRRGDRGGHLAGRPADPTSWWPPSTATTSSTSGPDGRWRASSNGVTAELTWPRTQIRHGQRRRPAPTSCYLVGPEPDFHWRQFVDAVVGPGPRLRRAAWWSAWAPSPLPPPTPGRSSWPPPPRAQSAELVARVGVVQGELEVPPGVLAALELGFGGRRHRAVSLWARVPHYVAAMPFPEASAALIDGLAAMAGLALDSTALRAAADSSRRQVDELMADNPEHVAMVRKLEESIDASEGNALGIEEMPSGDETGGRARAVPPGRAAVGARRHRQTVGARMKVDGGIGYDPTGIAEAARAAEETGYDGVWSAETGHDPFLPLAIAAAVDRAPRRWAPASPWPSPATR